MSVSDVQGVLQFICGAAGSLAGIAALIIYGTGKLSPESQTGTADARLVGCIIAAVAFFAAAVFCGTLDLSYS